MHPAPTVPDRPAPRPGRRSSTRRRRCGRGRRRLSTFVFAAAACSSIFGLFSWLPILRAVVHERAGRPTSSTPPTFVGLDNFRAVLADPLLRTAVQNTLYFALLALVFGYPVPLVLAVLMSERAPGARPVSARSPTCRWWCRRSSPSCCGSSSSTPARPASSTRSSAGSGSARSRGSQSPTRAMPSLVLEATWAAAGGDGHHLPRRPRLGAARALRRRRGRRRVASWRKVWHVTLPQLRGVLLITLILQIIGTVAGVPRAVPVHRRWTRPTRPSPCCC